MGNTKIEWCHMTVNPVVGCTFGCTYCYARKMNQRFGWVKDFFSPTFFEDRLPKLKTREPKIIFINSMSDIADWRPAWFRKTVDAIEKNDRNTYLALTKRPHQITPDVFDFKPENLWIGQTITKRYDTVDPRVDFLSVEPILEPVTIKPAGTNVKWVIIGAETGNRKNKVTPEHEWIESIVHQCARIGMPVFMKDSLDPIVGDRKYQQWPEYIKHRHQKEE